MPPPCERAAHRAETWLRRFLTELIFRTVRARDLGLRGKAAACSAVSRSIRGVFDIPQVEDSIQPHEADVVVEVGLRLRITYGYLRLRRRGPTDPSALPTSETVLPHALARNSTRLVLLSIRQVSRVAELATYLNQQAFA
jgi:hypothetical protein